MLRSVCDILSRQCKPRERHFASAARQTILSRTTFKKRITTGRALRPRIKDIRDVDARQSIAPFATKATSQKIDFTELEEMRAFIEQVGTSNDKASKEAILRGASDRIIQLLKLIYNDSTRFHVKASTLEKFLMTERGRSVQRRPPLSLYDTLLELQLQNARGYDAMDLLVSYLEHSGVIQESTERPETLVGKFDRLSAFLCCLDRNLGVGISTKTIENVYGDTDPSSSSYNSRTTSTTQKPTKKSQNIRVSLGFKLSPEELPALFAGRAETSLPWYVSRKLDGVRCIIEIEVDDKLRIGEIRTFSRNGKLFSTLDVLKQDLRKVLCRSETLQRIMRDIATSQDEKVSRILLDGEICLIKPAKEGDAPSEYAEDFRGISGQLQRKSHTIPNPAFFPFDVLTEGDLSAQTQGGASKGQLPFGERLERVQGIVDDCLQGGSQHIRRLEQVAVFGPEDVRKWSDIASAKGWEGLILRDGQALYEGKRTRSIRKVKQMQEDEYVVQDVEISEMRLAVNQQFAQRKALASVIIVHKGTPVNVGSGFTADQRIRFAENPDAIIGKQVTVAYFEESFATSRQGETAPSLRFPTIKAVWEEGKRDM